MPVIMRTDAHGTTFEVLPHKTRMPDQLVWWNRGSYSEAVLADFVGGDGVRFTLQEQPTCYRRGQWCLTIEIAHENHTAWGCFDGQDQPLRYYHVKTSALVEAQHIASVLWNDRFHFKVKERS